MSRALASLCVGVLLVLAMGCEPTEVPPTQVLVTVEGDLGASHGLVRVDTGVYDSEGQRASGLQSYAAPSEVSLPFSFAIVPAAKKAASKVLVVVTGRDAQGAMLAEAKGFVTFQDHQRLGMRLSLRSACIQMDCGARETCVVSATNVASCGDIEAPPTEIIPETRGGGAMDASTTTAVILSMDAGVVSTPALGSIGGQTLPSDGGAAIGMSTHDGGTLARDAGLRDAAMPLSDASIGGPTDTGLPSPFPRSDDATGVALRGPYTVGTYTDGLTSPLFTNPIIYYPMNATPPFAAVALAQTIATTRTHLMAWGPVLASHGIVAFLCDNNSPTENPPLRADALQGQINMLKAENTRADSPLRAKLDEARFGLFGWGMGGGGAFYVANRIPEKIRAFVALAPWISEMPTGSVFGFDRLTAATLILVASGDSVAPPEEHARFYYQRLSAAPRALGETVGTEPSPPFPPSETEPGRMVLAWFKLYLEGDARYETYFTGPRFTEIRSKFASFTSANR